jgi:hypothetical protein
MNRILCWKVQVVQQVAVQRLLMILHHPDHRGDTQANYSDIGIKTVTERNTLQRRCDSAKQQQRYHGCAGCQLQGGQRIKILHRTLIELQYFSASVLHRVNQSTMGSYSDWQELCARLLTRCLYDDSATLEKGLGTMSQVQSQHQRLDTLRTGQL